MTAIKERIEVNRYNNNEKKTKKSNEEKKKKKKRLSQSDFLSSFRVNENGF